MIEIISGFLAIIVFILFILALRGLSSASTAVKGNKFGMFGMGLAIIPSAFSLRYLDHFQNSFLLISLFIIVIAGVIGFYIAKKIDMTSLPQLLAAFHSLVGLAAVFIACSIFCSPESFGITLDNGKLPIINIIEMSLGASIGAITFSGSIVAFGKLQGIISGKPIRYLGQNKINLGLGIIVFTIIYCFSIYQNTNLFTYIILFSFILGYLLIIPIGGADMPVVISMLNSYSGWAAVGIGFSLEKDLLIIVGSLVGTSGAILSHIMCKGMNRSLLNVIFRNNSKNVAVAEAENNTKGNVKICTPEDAGFIIKNAESVIIVPGYGMAVAQAQHAIKELADNLKSSGISVKYAIHPVAGRMPGHMNVLLAEANIPYEDVFERDEINHEFGSTDIAIVIGANDITNPAAKNDPSSPIYGMPVLDVEKAKTVFFIKRSLGSGYAGIDNSLFYQNNTMMILGDAKKVSEDLLKAIKNL